jgi:hypothetical protein
MSDAVQTVLHDPVALLIAVCEIGFWVVLGLGLAVRYGLRRHRLSLALLLLSPLLDLVLLVVATADLLGGATAGFAHGLAAGYLAGTIVWGHAILRRADGWVAYRFAGGPRPPKPPRYGAAKVRHEWAEWGKAVVFWAIACGLLGAITLVVGDPDRTAALTAWMGRYTLVLVIWLVVDPVWVTLSPPEAPAGEDAAAERQAAANR